MGKDNDPMNYGEKARLHDHFNSSFDATRYTPSGSIDVGARKLYYLDGSDAYANLRKMTISIQHVPTARSIYFKAFITNFIETFSPEWAEEKVYGRPDSIFLYKNTGRAFAIGYSIPASNAREAYENLGKVQMLTQFLYPSYEMAGEAQTIAQSPLLRLKVMNLGRKINPTAGPQAIADKERYKIYNNYRSDPASSEGLLGVLTTLTVDHHLHDVGAFVKASNTILPKLIDLTFDFKVIHEHPVGWDAQDQFGPGGANELFPYGVRLDDPFAKTRAKHPTATTWDALQKAFEQDEKDQAKAQAQLEQHRAARERFANTSSRRAGRMLTREGQRQMRGGPSRFNEEETSALVDTFLDLPSGEDES
jgi:hypothetical protein